MSHAFHPKNEKEHFMRAEGLGLLIRLMPRRPTQCHVCGASIHNDSHMEQLHILPCAGMALNGIGSYDEPKGGDLIFHADSVLKLRSRSYFDLMNCTYTAMEDSPGWYAGSFRLGSAALGILCGDQSGKRAEAMT